MAIDFPMMLTNLGTSLEPVQRLIGATTWLMGLVFFYKGIAKFRTSAAARDYSNFKGTFAYLGVGILLFYFPTTLQTFLVTAYGYDSPLAYSAWLDYLIAKYGNFTATIVKLIWLMGLVWFIRGFVLLASPNRPEEKRHKRGLIYIVAGILAINITATANILTATLQSIMTATLRT